MVNQKWFPYALLLSLLFIIFFNVGAFSIQKIGLIITGIFQKLSLVFPVITGILFFGEINNVFKSIAIILSILAIILINLPDKSETNEISVLRKYWYLPFLVLIGNGLIEITLFYVEANNLVVGTSLDFVTSLFCLAGIWGLIFMISTRKKLFTKRDVMAGICLGIPNFFTIYLLIKALQVGWEGSVLFPINNVGTLFFTAVVGVLLFKEKLNIYNYLGLGLAILGVVLISL